MFEANESIKQLNYLQPKEIFDKKGMLLVHPKNEQYLLGPREFIDSISEIKNLFQYTSFERKKQSIRHLISIFILKKDTKSINKYLQQKAKERLSDRQTKYQEIEMQNQARNLKDFDNEIQVIFTKSQQIFNKQKEGKSQMQLIFQLLEQYEYIKQKVGCKPQYLQQFVKDYQNMFGFLSQSIGMNANLINSEMHRQNNERLQTEFNKLEQLRRSLTLGFEKQILIYCENAKQNTTIKAIVEESLNQMRKSNGSLSEKKNDQQPITTHLFENDANLREHILNKSKSQPIIIIATRSNLLNHSTLEYLQDINKTKFLRLEGIVCLTKPQKLKQTEKQFNQCALSIKCLDNEQEAAQAVYDIVNKNQFQRIVSMDDYSFYMQISVSYFQQKAQDLYRSGTSLISFKNTNYPQIFDNLAKYIDSHGISMYKDNYNIKAINDMCINLRDKVFNTTNDEQIAANFIRLYTLESPFYKLVNSCLNVLNEGLIKCIEPIILPLYLALIKVKQQEQSAFVTTNNNFVTLYRGTTIPKESKESIKDNKQLILPAFSSFTTVEDIAVKFMKYTKSDDDSLRVLFVAKCPKNANSDNNPKYLRYLSAIPTEEEYLLPPFSLFKVTSSTQEKDGSYKVYLQY